MAHRKSERGSETWVHAEINEKPFNGEICLGYQ